MHTPENPHTLIHKHLSYFINMRTLNTHTSGVCWYQIRFEWILRVLSTSRWEYDESYCEAVKKMPPYDAGPRLLDVIDTAIFDYLIGNADRHHYESFQDDGGASMLILLDNAKR